MGDTKNRPVVDLVAASVMREEAGKLPPQAPEIEQLVLGATMLVEGTYDEIGFLKDNHFYVHSHSKIWAAIASVAESGAHPDMGLVTEALKKAGTLDIVGGAFYVSQLTNKVAGSTNAEYYARIIIQKWILREHIRIAAEVSTRGYDDQTDSFELAEFVTKELDAVMEVAQHRPSISINELATDQLKRMDEPARPAHTTGMPGLNRLLSGGWQPGDFWVVSARPGMGKTSFALASAVGAAKEGAAPSLFFELELSERVTNCRSLSAYGGFKLADLISRNLDEHELRRLHAEHKGYSELPLFFNFSTSAGIDDMRREIARFIRQHQIGCVYIDQANWIKVLMDKWEKRTEDQIITRAMRRMALEFDIPIILLHQMNREITGRVGHRPRLSDLKKSGSYEEDANGVLFVHRPEYYGETEDDLGSCIGRADLIVAKHSNGATGTHSVRFDAPSVSFIDDLPSSHFPPPSSQVADPDRWTEPLKQTDANGKEIEDIVF